MTLEVLYFGAFSEQAGVSVERVDHAVGDLPGLYAACARRHGFSLAQARVRAAVNDEFVAWEYALAEGDRVAFMPPVCGG